VGVGRNKLTHGWGSHGHILGSSAIRLRHQVGRLGRNGRGTASSMGRAVLGTCASTPPPPFFRLVLMHLCRSSYHLSQLRRRLQGGSDVHCRHRTHARERSGGCAAAIGFGRPHGRRRRWVCGRSTSRLLNARKRRRRTCLWPFPLPPQTKYTTNAASAPILCFRNTSVAAPGSMWVRGVKAAADTSWAGEPLMDGGTTPRRCIAAAATSCG